MTTQINIDKLTLYFEQVARPGSVTDVYYNAAEEQYFVVLYNGDTELHVMCDPAELNVEED